MSTSRHRRALVAHLLRADVKFVPEPTYIYGRYKLRDSDELREEFYPVISGERTKWLDEYCKAP